MFRLRDPGLLEDFQGPDDPFAIMRTDSFSSYRIDLLQFLVQLPEAFLIGPLGQLLAQGRIGFGFDKINTFDECTDIQACTATNDWPFPATQNIFDRCRRFLLKASHAVSFIRFATVNQMVRDACLLSPRDLGGADIEVAVDLHRICRNNLAVYLLGHGDRHRRLARSSRATNDRNHWRGSHLFRQSV